MNDAITTRRQLIKTAAVVGTVAAMPRGLTAAESDNKPVVRRYKISCAAYGYRKYLPSGGKPAPETIFDFLDLCAKWGCDGTELTTYYFTQNDPEYLHKLKRQAFLLGLDVTSTAIGNNYVCPAGEERTKQIQDTKAWIDRAVLIGAPVIRVFAGRPKEGVDREQAFQFVTETLKPVCDYAGEKAVFLGVENHGYLTENAEDVLRIVDTLNHPWLRINLDTGNFIKKPYESIALAAPKAVTCQIKVEIRSGQGDAKEPVDLKRVVGILRQANYKGYLVLEYEGKEEPKTAIPKWIQRLQQVSMYDGDQDIRPKIE